MLIVSNTVRIPLEEIEIKAVLSQGAGGQHVNKVSTAIHLSYDIAASSLPRAVKERLLSKSDSRMTNEGVLVLKSQEGRSREANRERALERLRHFVKSATVVPKKRRPTKPTAGSKERRLKGKLVRSRKKEGRRRVKGDAF
ncbi:MAG: aminoacyl-tRNA hydrolase [Symploca sp. SIO2D2]|nr:aminoacyl-tRNA hydrolase [Symploca sp. SIO2D2]